MSNDFEDTALELLASVRSIHGDHSWAAVYAASGCYLSGITAAVIAADITRFIHITDTEQREVLSESLTKLGRNVEASADSALSVMLVKPELLKELWPIYFRLKQEIFKTVIKRVRNAGKSSN